MDMPSNPLQKGLCRRRIPNYRINDGHSLKAELESLLCDNTHSEELIRAKGVYRS